VRYLFNWGDGTNSAWLPIGQTSASKSWTSGGTYSVKAQARCSSDASVVSAWSGVLFVTISTNTNVRIISVSPTSKDYGNVKVSRSRTASFVVKNNGKANLSITSSTITGTDASMFKITSGGGSKTLKPGKSLTIKVAFKPTSTGPKSAILEINSNDPIAPTIDIPLTGTGQ